MILLPYAHEKQTVQRLPWVTFILIAINVVVFFFTHFNGINQQDAEGIVGEFQEYYYTHPYLEVPPEMQRFFTKKDLEQIALLKEGTDFTQISAETRREEQAQLNILAKKVLRLINQNPFRKYGFVPGDPHWYALITCLFMHTGWFHLIGNMLFLYLAGCSIEDLWGRPLYVGFYLLSGIAATLVHYLKFPGNMMPIVGASGAIAGLMGAFLVRLYNTKIYFIYILFLFGIRFGTFQAPAYIMLPLWLLEQVFYAAISDESAGVAFWAHIGGFSFGAGFAYLIQMVKIEEKFIAPSIEKKVSLVQNPDFLRGMEISESGDYPNALVLLEKVVRQEPNHLDAYMEMRRIAEIQRDPHLYTKYTAAILDILIRNRDWEFLTDVYKQFQGYPGRDVLPAKTLFGLGSHFEESQEYSSAVELFGELTNSYPDDPLSVKALNRIYKICFDHLSNREQGIQAFWKCYQNKLAIDHWRSVLDTDLKRYEIPPLQIPAMAAAVPFDPSLPVETEVGTVESANEYASSLKLQPQPSFVPQQNLDPPRAPARTVDKQSLAGRIEPPPDAGDYVVLPNQAFDGGPNGAWTLIACQVEKITLRGIIVRNKDRMPGFLPWKKIETVSVAKIRKFDPADPRKNREFLLLDLIAKSGGMRVVYRVPSDQLYFEKIFPRLEQTFEEAFQNFVGIILNNSGARCIPNRDSCIGPTFASFPDEERYDNRLKEKLAVSS